MAQSSETVGPVTKFKAAKAYLDENNIPQMFECLIASLMMERPDNPYQHLDKQLNMMKEIGLENVNWETYVSHLHPTKDPVRIETIQDETSLKLKGKQSGPTEAAYNPDVFKLTETQTE